VWTKVDREIAAVVDKASRVIKEAQRVVRNCVAHYCELQLHCLRNYVTPHHKRTGRDAEIFASRDNKRKPARAKRTGATSSTGRQAIAHAVLM
jgi:oligoribonuclease (3'-5' exoribonuclease)